MVVHASDPSTSMTSPTRSGRSMSSNSPLMTFFSKFCVPNPTPMAKAPPKREGGDGNFHRHQVTITRRKKTGQGPLPNDIGDVGIDLQPGDGPLGKPGHDSRHPVPTIKIASAVTTFPDRDAPSTGDILAVHFNGVFGGKQFHMPGIPQHHHRGSPHGPSCAQTPTWPAHGGQIPPVCCRSIPIRESVRWSARRYRSSRWR